MAIQKKSLVANAAPTKKAAPIAKPVPSEVTSSEGPVASRMVLAKKAASRAVLSKVAASRPVVASRTIASKKALSKTITL